MPQDCATRGVGLGNGKVKVGQLGLPMYPFSKAYLRRLSPMLWGSSVV